MSTQIKQRIIGGLVLLALLAIFLPLFFNNPHPSATLSNHPPGVPQKPQVQLQLPQIAQSQTEAVIKPQSEPVSSTVAQQSAEVMPAVAQDAAPAVAVAVAPKAVAKKPVAVAQAPKPSIKKPVNIAEHVNQLKKSKAWVVQLASFGSGDNAKRLVNKLRASGYEAYSRQARYANGRVIYKVFVGPEISRNRIQNLQQQLSKHYRLKGMIKRYSA